MRLLDAERLKVGAFVYEIVKEPKEFGSIDEEEARKQGDCNVGEHIEFLKRIRVTEKDYGEPLADDVKNALRLHEVLHALSRVFGLELCERQVAGLTGALSALIADNDLDLRSYDAKGGAGRWHL